MSTQPRLNELLVESIQGQGADEKIQRLLKFRELVLAGNQVQNLTRIVSEEDFFFGHILDCLKIQELGWIQEQNIDLGTGMGVPGLICAILEPTSRWILVDSEKKKAAFVAEATEQLGLGQRVEVFSDRIESLSHAKLKSSVIFSRAVGKVDKIYGWIEKCSTWNSLVLFKGPNWQEEWKEFQSHKFKSPLRIQDRIEYSAQEKNRVLVRLTRTQ